MRPLGDEAGLIDVADHREARRLARRITAREVVPAETTVGVVGPFSLDGAEEDREPVRRHEIAVVLDGPDLVELGLSRRRLAEMLDSCTLEVAFLGFMPGFAYLVGLPPALARLRRRERPRQRVPAGSFAVAGGYAGFYPSGSPGGWNLLGRTDVSLFDPVQPPHALLRPGDTVRLRPVDALPEPEPLRRRPLEGDALEVLEPGPLLLVEDGGRTGAAHLGVPRAGTANMLAHRIANEAVGNDVTAALETLGGTRLVAQRELLLALVGHAPLRIDGAQFPPGTVARVSPGQLVEVGPISRHGRAVLAVGGGIDCPVLFSSRSGDPVSGLPPGALRRGDRLSVGPAPSRARSRFEIPSLAPATTLRAILGPDDVGPALLAGRFRVDRRSDRTGLLLGREERANGALTTGSPIASHATVPGAIQFPSPDAPVILGVDSGPVGGYPVGATVITSDLWRLGMLFSGASVEIELVSLESAEAARKEVDMAVSQALSGWFPISLT